jgi:hypothetical protein
MKQLNLFSRVTVGLALMREELNIGLAVDRYRRELRELADITDDPEYVTKQSDLLIHLIELNFQRLATARQERKNLSQYYD